MQSNGSSVNVLFCSVGRRVELLRAFSRAVKTLNTAGRIIAVDIDPLAPALRLADRPYIVPRLNSPDYMASLTDICRREQVNIVFPLIDPDIPILSANRRVLEQIGARPAVIPLESVSVASDKWCTAEFFKQLDLAIPRSWLPGSPELDRAEYPLFIKPRDGSAAKSTFKVSCADELDFFIHYVPDPIIQEYLPGPEITNDVICDLDGKVLAVISRQRIEARWGEVAKGITVYNPEITEGCIRIAKALPAVGPITVQCMMRENKPYFTEINARMGGGLPLGIVAGADSPLWLLAKTAGLPVDIPPVGTYQTGLYLTRYDESFFLTKDEYEQMGRHRL